MVNFNSIITVIFLAFFVFGGYKLATDDKVSLDIKNNIMEQTTANPIWTMIFIKTLDDLSPTLKYKLPFTDKKIFLINEFPLFGYLHTLVIIMLLFIFFFIIRFRYVAMGNKFLIIILIIILGYFIASGLILFLYNMSSSQIGFTLEESTEFRRMYSNQFDNILTPIIVISLVGLFSILKVIFYMNKNVKRNPNN